MKYTDEQIWRSAALVRKEISEEGKQGKEKNRDGTTTWLRM